MQSYGYLTAVVAFVAGVTAIGIGRLVPGALLCVLGTVVVLFTKYYDPDASPPRWTRRMSTWQKVLVLLVIATLGVVMRLVL